MPLATIHLISVIQSTTIPAFVKALKVASLEPLVVSKVIRWIILPEKIDVNPLLHPVKPWDLLLIVPGNDSLPASITKLIECHWAVTTGIPSRLTNAFSTSNRKLLHPDPSSIPQLTGSLDKPRRGKSSQTLELSTDLQSWITGFSKTNAGRNAMSMLNLLAFKPDMKSSYQIYGKAFGESIGAKRGGTAKLVGNIIHPPSPAPQTEGKWDEFALAHYPSILHFADMIASEDYQAVNFKYRLPALEDTYILCTSEIELESIVAEEIGQEVTERREAKL